MPTRGVWARAALGAGLLVLAGCAARPPADPAGLTPVAFDRLPGWTQDHAAEALAAFQVGCTALTSEPPDATLGGQGRAAALGGSPAAWAVACADAAAVSPDDASARAFFERDFRPYAILPPDGSRGLFTGYYEPEVRGSRSPGGAYRWPLYSRPRDLVSVDLRAFANGGLGRIENNAVVPDPGAGAADGLVRVDPGAFDPAVRGKHTYGRVADGQVVPYWTRAEITAGALRGKRDDLIWLADPVDAFFIQVQGSGRVRLPDGRVARVSYDGQNGWPYVPIGRVLVDRGEMTMDQVTMQNLRIWLDAHPAEMQGVMNANPRMVFFREVIGVGDDQGPRGTLGVPLTPGRSLAVDRSFIPLGAPVYLDTFTPDGAAPLRRLTVAEDIGGALHGPLRGDIFFGWGADAEAEAGRMSQHGAAWLLLPNQPKTAQR